MMATKLLKMSDGVKELNQEEAFISVIGLLKKISSKFPTIEFDDAFQIASIGFLEAWERYSNLDIKFSTYVALVSKQHLFREIKAMNTMKRSAIVTSLDSEMSDSKVDNTYKDHIEDISVDYDFTNSVVIKQMLDSLEGKEKEIFVEYFIKGYSLEEIAKKRGTYRQLIHCIKNKIVKKLSIYYDKAC